MRRPEASGAWRDAALGSAFPGAARYADLLCPPPRALREAAPAETAFPYSERHLQCVWFDAALRPARLLTNAGELLRVEDPGRWNLEAGPDFLDARLMLGPGRRRLQGDVEVHVRPSDWAAHGHRHDPAYARVVVHVTYFPGSVPAGARGPAGVEVALRDPLRENPFFSFDDIDLAAYPYAVPPGPNCACARILARWPDQDRALLLESAGQERLRRKTMRIAEALRGADAGQVLYQEVLAALGYKHNRLAFQQLARRLPLEALRRESGHDVLTAYALLLGVSGLLPLKMPPAWDRDTRAFLRSLWDRWWKHRATSDVDGNPPRWRLSGVRPQNHPVRRMAAAAALFAPEAGLAARLRAADPAEPGPWLREVQSLLRGAGAPAYWRRRLSFSGKIQKADVELVGKGRRAAILSNIVVPFVAAAGGEVLPLLALLPAEEDNSLVRQAAHRLFGRDHNPLLYAGALRRQGLIQIFQDFCLNSRAGCAGCRLAARLG